LEEVPELERLHGIKSAPKELYIKCDYDPALFRNCAAVVGSRRMTAYGREVVERLVPRLVFAGKTVVSGMMYGVDQYAHEVCLQHGGATVAVLGWGINAPMDDDSKKLARAIVFGKGLLLSEWNEQKAALWTFPARNRIVAGLAEDVYVVEADVKSGSLVTADLALKQKRKLWAVPGPITSRQSRGTNMLIAERKARMWLPDDDPPAAREPSGKANTILALVQNEPLTLNEIARETKRPVSELGAELSTLVLQNLLRERNGKYYAR
jgi:DNA processing protein